MAHTRNKSRKATKHVNFRKVSPCRFEWNDPNEKSYWINLVNDVEKLAKEKAKKTKLRHMNLWSALPPKLHARVSKYIKVPPDSEEDVDGDYTNLNDIDEPREIKKLTLEHFNESTLSEVLEEERAYRVIKLKIDAKPERRSKAHRNVNWLSDYFPKKQKDRVRWRSKLYKMEKSILEKPLFEQAEEIMDRAAENFAEWVNGLGTTEEGNLTKDMVKQLFSIELTEGASAAIHIAPKELKAVPHEVAQKLNLPQMSLEVQVKKHCKDKQAQRMKKPLKVAFGRTLPVSMREWVPSDNDKQMQPIFPEELRTKETLFKGISHLRSTKLLVDHYLQDEQLMRPQYLVDIGSFKPQIKEEFTEHIPLYERFKKNRI